MGTEYPSGNGRCRGEADPDESVYQVSAYSKQTAEKTEAGNRPELNSDINMKGSLGLPNKAVSYF